MQGYDQGRVATKEEAAYDSSACQGLRGKTSVFERRSDGSSQQYWKNRGDGVSSQAKKPGFPRQKN